MNIVIEVFTGKGRKPWRYRIVSSANGQTMMQSQGYFSKWNRDRAVRNLVKHNPGLEVRESG